MGSNNMIIAVICCFCMEVFRVQHFQKGALTNTIITLFLKSKSFLNGYILLKVYWTCWGDVCLGNISFAGLSETIVLRRPKTCIFHCHTKYSSGWEKLRLKPRFSQLKLTLIWTAIEFKLRLIMAYSSMNNLKPEYVNKTC